MADLITLASGITIKKASGVDYYQDITESVDVSAYDSLDFHISLNADNADGATVIILTSMQNKNDDIAAGLSSPSWYPVGTSIITVTAGVTSNKGLSVPSSSGTAPLLRYIRYKITLGASTNNVTFSITGLARRGLRVG